MNIQKEILSAFTEVKTPRTRALKLFREFLSLLDNGIIRAAEQIDGEWHVHEWVKKGILLGFRLGTVRRIPHPQPFRYFDKDTIPLKNISRKNGTRIVPGGTSIRRGAFVAPSVIIMPPSFVNIGAYVDEGTMIDSHALVGSCAQVGKRVHLSAASQIGGVLEPIGNLPVVIDDDVTIGGNCGIYEGTIVSKRAVIGAGVTLTSSTPVYDLVHEKIIKRNSSGSLVIPENAVVIAGSRKIDSSFAERYGLHLSTPLIVKYRDRQTDSKTALEEGLR